MPIINRLQQDEERRHLLWKLERELFAQGFRHLAGVDEAGRGPLAGPVVVAAVILPPDYWFPGLNDSKKVTKALRERMYPDIVTHAVSYAIEVVSVEVIDELNILRATHHGMRMVIQALSPLPEMAMIDGLPLPDAPTPQYAIVKGDQRSASIAAASILAKVTRDRLMVQLDAQYPHYGFAQHKGYATVEHRAKLQKFGPCPCHRRSFTLLPDDSQVELPFIP